MKHQKKGQTSRENLRKRAAKKPTAPPNITEDMSAEEIKQLVNELHLHQIELETQNEELRDAQSQLEESRTKYSDLYDYSPLCYFTFDTRGLIRQANLTAATEFGVERENLVNAQFQTYIAAEDSDIFYNHLREVCTIRKRATCEMQAVREDKSEFFACLVSIPVEDAEGNCLCRSSLIDITDIKRTQMERQKELELSQDKQELMSALLESARSILESRNFEESARSIFDSCKKITGATAGYVALLSEQGIENEVLFLDSGGMDCSVDPDLPMPIRGLRAEAYTTGTVVFENDFAKSKWMHYLPEGHSQVDNVLFAPLVIHEKTVGLLGLANKPKGFTEDDAQKVQAFTQLASISLMNSRNIDALEESEKRFRTVVHTAKEAIITVDSGGLISFWNPEAENYFGYSAAEAIGQSCHMIMPEEYRQTHQKSLSDLVTTGETKLDGKSIELIGLRKDGTTFPVELSLAKWKMADEIYFTSMIRDISKRKQAENDLKKSEQRFRDLFRHMKGGGAVYKAIDQGRDFVFVDYHRPSGLVPKTDPHSKRGKSVLEVFPKAKQYGLFEVFHRVWQTGKAEYHPVTIYDGDKIAGWRENYVYKLSTGEIVALYDDLTERKQVEEALKEREELFRTIFKTSPDAISISTLKEGKFFNVNEGFTHLTGYTAEEVIGKTSIELKIWNDPKGRENLLVMLERDGEVNNYEGEFCIKNGRIIPCMFSARIIPLNKEMHILAVAKDISDLKKKEQAREVARQELERRVKERTAELAEVNEELRRQMLEREQAQAALVESEIKYSTLVEDSLTGVHISLNGKLIFTNEQFAIIFGYSRDELVQMDTLQLIHPDDRDMTKKIRSKRLKGEDVPAEYEVRGLRKDGETIWLIRRNTVIDYGGKPAILGNIMDITKRKIAQKALAESEKELRVLSTKLLSAEEMERKRIAQDLHDSIGQTLSAIKFAVENAITELSENAIPPDSLRPLQRIVPLTINTIEEVRKIIVDLRPSILDDLGIIATISWLCREFTAIYSMINIEKEITLEETDISPLLKTVIFRILQEALNNAAKYSRAERIRLSLAKIKGIIELTIEDRGVGFNVDEILASTTEKRGLGLASMRERALLIGGTFDIASTPGSGTTIRATWPAEYGE